jgi:hypothetical protein
MRLSSSIVAQPTGDFVSPVTLKTEDERAIFP